MQQEFAGPTEHIYKTNIELKVEVESLKQKLQERDQLLISGETNGSLELACQPAQQTQNKVETQLLIEELKLSLKSKEALIQCLQEEKSQMASPDENVSSGELQGLSATLREAKERDAEREWQKERNHLEENIQALQLDLREKEREIATEKKNNLKSYKAIQGLTMALKSKEKEVEALNSEIKELTAALTKPAEAPLITQATKFQVRGPEDYEAALAEKEALLAQLHSENLTKSAENQRLLRNAKVITQELSDLKKEKLRLEKDLEEAHKEGSKRAHTILDLRNEVEKLRNEVNGREKVLEKHYRSLPSESSTKLHTAEQVLGCLTESGSQKNQLLQKSNEKDLDIIQHNCYLMTAKELKFGNDGLVTEKCSQQSPGSKLISKEKQQSDEGLTGDLTTEQSIYAHLAKTLQDSDRLKEVLALRKQLEQIVLAYRNLQKALQDQLSEIQRREEEPFSLYSDQTSYLSICLEEHNQLQVEHFSQEELKKKVSELIQLVKDLYTDNQHLKKTIFDLSSMGFQGNDRLESTKQTELLAIREDEGTFKIEADDENLFQSDQHLEQGNEIMEDYAKSDCKNEYLRHMDSNILDHDGANTPGIPGDQSLEDKLLGLLATLFQKKATLLLEASRPDLLKALGALVLERIYSGEQELPGDHLDSKAKKALQQVAVQLRDELDLSFSDNSFSKSHNELKSTWETWLVKKGDRAKVELKNASMQTITIEDTPHEFKSKGKREAWKEKPEETVFSTDPESEALCEMPRLGATPLSFPNTINKDAEKTELMIQLKASELLENVYDLPASAEVVAQLQGQVLELQGELKEYKRRNKKLHDKLILAEAMMEGMTIPNPVLNEPAAVVRAVYQDNPGEQEGPETIHSAWKDKEADSDQYSSFEIDSEMCPPDDLALLPACKENTGDFLGPTSVATYLNSKSQLSIKDSVIGTDQSENINNPNDTEDLKQDIHDFQTELDSYRNFIVQLLQKYSQCSEAIITVSCGTDGAQDGLNKPMGQTDEEEMTVSSLHQVRYVKHMKILHPLTPEMIDSGMLENLKQHLVDQEKELQKEQDLNLKLFSEIHNLEKKFRDLSPSRYDSLVQSQARELSLQRHTMIKAFEELLQASDVDSCVAEGFREQLTQCAELPEQLEKLFLHGALAGAEPHPQRDLQERLRTEEDNLTHHFLPDSAEPSASHALSDDEMSDKSFLSLDQKADKTGKFPAMENHFPQDLLMEHIQEIRTLRKHLEEFIKTNEKLRKQLEHQKSETNQGSTNVSAYGSELHSSLTSEIHFLRKQNQALSMMLAKGARDKQKENEKLLESLSRKAASLEHLHLEYTSVKEENERLQRDISEKERHNQQLTQEMCSTRQELSRVQEEMKSRQQLLSQNDKLLQALRVELKVYEKLGEEHRKPQRDGTKCPEASDNSLDLFESTQAMAPKAASETPLLSGTDIDSLSCDSSTSIISPPCVPCLVAEHHVWASKSGHHMLGLIEDYDALHKQISRGQRLLAKMDIQTQEALGPTSQKLGPKVPLSVPLSKFLSSMNTARLILEEASRLLTLFWRVSVPTDGQCPLHCKQIGELKSEITKLHRKLFEQEKKLQNTAKLLQQKKHQEKVIWDQLVITHQVLQKARQNLEQRTRTVHSGTSSPSRPGS
ncbi:CDK5 regulatory subunit-associated protein 2 [Lemmus lemmus]